MKKKMLIISGIIVLLSSHICAAAVIQVGPGRTYTKPSQAAAVAAEGDIVEIDAGLYEDDAAVWRTDDIEIRGVGGRAHLNVDGYTIPNRKAIWVIAADDITIENIEFSHASVPDRNGAGIRQEGTNLTIRHCYFHDNQMGILTSNTPSYETLIEFTEFARHGYGDGLSHNIYVGRQGKFTMRFCYSHDANIGHNVKSRAAENYILYNKIMDGADGNASYQIDLPNGGKSYIIGNIIHQGVNAPNNKAISYAAEGAVNPIQELYVSHNTFINDRSSSRAIRTAGTPTGKVVNNIFDNFSTIFDGGTTLAHENNIETDVSNPAGFMDRNGYDFHLIEESQARNSGINPGEGSGFSLFPEFAYKDEADGEQRFSDGVIDIGAYEYVGGTENPADLNGDGVVNVADAIYCVNAILDGGSADVNGDGATNVQDVVEIINLILES